MLMPALTGKRKQVSTEESNHLLKIYDLNPMSRRIDTWDYWAKERSSKPPKTEESIAIAENVKITCNSEKGVSVANSAHSEKKQTLTIKVNHPKNEKTKNFNNTLNTLLGAKGQLAYGKMTVNTPHISQKINKKLININMCHFNCQGLASEERLVELENALEREKIDILGLTEVRRNSEQLIQHKNGNIFYYYGSTKGYRGVE